MENRNTLYVLIDKTLDPVYGAVQGGHATAEWLIYQYKLKFNKFTNEYEPKWKWNNDYLVYLKVDIDKWYKMIQEEHCGSYEEFREPDLNDKITAIAIHESGMTDYIKHKIKKEELL